MLTEDDIDLPAIIMLIENNMVEFEEHSGGEESAEATLNALKREAGMIA